MNTIYPACSGFEEDAGANFEAPTISNFMRLREGGPGSGPQQGHGDGAGGAADKAVSNRHSKLAMYHEDKENKHFNLMLKADHENKKPLRDAHDKAAEMHGQARDAHEEASESPSDSKIVRLAHQASDRATQASYDASDMADTTSDMDESRTRECGEDDDAITLKIPPKKNKDIKLKDSKESGTVKCSECGTMNSSTLRECTECGANLQGTSYGKSALEKKAIEAGVFGMKWGTKKDQPGGADPDVSRTAKNFGFEAHSQGSDGSMMFQHPGTGEMLRAHSDGSWIYRHPNGEKTSGSGGPGLVSHLGAKVYHKESMREGGPGSGPHKGSFDEGVRVGKIHVEKLGGGELDKALAHRAHSHAAQTSDSKTEQKRHRDSYINRYRSVNKNQNIGPIVRPLAKRK